LTTRQRKSKRKNAELEEEVRVVKNQLEEINKLSNGQWRA
jgi:hypothetical protein